MEFYRFKEEVCSQIKAKLGEGYEIKLTQVLKNNDQILWGITISEKDCTIAPAIYVNEFYEAFRNGADFAEIVNTIIDIYSRSRINMSFDLRFFFDFEKVKTRILFKLIDKERNRTLLEQVPHLPYLNLAIVFYYLIQQEPFGNSTILIRNTHMNFWKKNLSEIYSCALVNTPKLLPVTILPMEEIIKELMSQHQEKNEKANHTGNQERNTGKYDYANGSLNDNECLGENFDDTLKSDFSEAQMEEEFILGKTARTMYVLSNDQKLQGAASLLYPRVLEDFSRALGGNFYLLPSSIHEVILIPETGREEPQKMKEMVCEINETQLEKEEILSDEIYFYSFHEKELSLCGS